jgi:hypothetical protein
MLAGANFSGMYCTSNLSLDKHANQSYEAFIVHM